ncbi:MAG: ribonuclease P protein component [bacterium]|nr:ribonuclease P protein component [bacterium]
MRTLRRPWQFREVYRTGRKIDCKYAIVFYRRTGVPESEPQFGFVASKRVGNSVKRNRAKRLLREVVRKHANRFQYEDLWVVLVARADLLNATFQDISAEVDARLAAAGLIDI